MSLVNLMAQDLAAGPGAVLDSHGDLAETVLRCGGCEGMR